ncbi:hypothetical protein [Nocardioides donggukensis]|uniref:DoxX family membrane protein n=1 Tax=Nocardioides donggukensis TaxID=2774019 RepID=A0A927K6Q5_9ACTN|nr:hypothetical protein [Nocardioides donggukensis]MBD8870170.1 hypothetical protein [Nocardioides donggukensis]
MSVLNHRAGHEAPSAPGETAGLDRTTRRALAVLRLGFGLTFLWAFLDKTFALGFGTGYDQQGVLDRFGPAAWVNGGSPTEGYLTFSPDGPFAEAYRGIAGAAWADWLFMAGLLGVGISLTFGVAMRVGCAAGALMYVLMWSVVLPPANHPFLDEHLLGAMTLVVLALTAAGDTWGLGRHWARTSVVRSHEALR